MSDISSNIELFSNDSSENKAESGKLGTSPMSTFVSTITSEIENEIEEIIEQPRTWKELNENLLEANYEVDKELQIVKTANKSGNKELLNKKKNLKRYAELMNELRVDGELVFRDDRLVISQALRPALINAIHQGHPGRDSMIAATDEYWWPDINRQLVAIAKTCKKCQQSGKNLKTLKSPKQFGKLTKATEQNEEVAFDFIGPFLEAHKEKKYILAAIDQYSS